MLYLVKFSSNKSYVQGMKHMIKLEKWMEFNHVFTRD